MNNVVMDRIPNNLRVPLFYMEFDPSRTGLAVDYGPALLVGQMLAAGSAAPDVPLRGVSLEEAVSLFGQGSMLASMAATYRDNDAFGEIWFLPLADNPAGVAAEGTLAFGGAATRAGTLQLYISGIRVQVGVASGQAAASLASVVASTINGQSHLPVSAAAAGDNVTVTAKHKGSLGNDIDLRVNYLGTLGGEVLPAGITLDITAMVNGAADPALDDGLANLGDDLFDYYAIPYTDTASLDAIKTHLDDITGRWSWSQQIYGHAFAARTGTVAELGTAGNARNDPHVSIMGTHKSPTHPANWSAALAAQAASSLNIDPARPLQTLPLISVLPPAREHRFNMQERNTLLYDGVSTYTVRDDGTVQIERLITTYQKNAFGDPHTAWLDVNTPATLTRFARRMRSLVTTKFGRSKLADDGDLGRGSNTVTPAIVRAAIEAEYRAMEREGLVENFEAFKKALIVERDANDPNRLNVLLNPDLVNQLRIFAAKNQFLLQQPLAA